MDNINESSDLIAIQNINNGENGEEVTNKENEENGENNENAENTDNTATTGDTENVEKENGDIDPGNRTDDDTASDSGASRRSEAVDYTKSDEYKGLVKEIRQNLLCATRIQLKNLSALVRRVAVLLLEFLGSTTLDIDELLTSYVRINSHSIFVSKTPCKNFLVT